MAFSKVMRERVFVRLEQLCVNPELPVGVKLTKCRGPALSKELHYLHHETERPASEQLVGLVREDTLHASANPEILDSASQDMLSSPKRSTLVDDCRKVIVALSHSPQTPDELNKLFKALYGELREKPVDYEGRVSRALRALKEVGAVIAFGHARMLSWRWLVSEKLAFGAGKRVLAFQKRVANKTRE